MPVTGVFFVPSNPNASTVFSAVTERLHSALAEEPIIVGRWALEHKLMRDTPSCLPTSASQRSAHPKYMQFLSLSHYPNHGFIYTSQSPDNVHHPGAGSPVNAATPASSPAPSVGGGLPATATPSTAGLNSTTADNSAMVMTTVPLPACSILFQHFVYACQPFWCHRHTVAVPGGVVYDVGDFRVRVGDVRQTAPAARVRGTVVEIEWKGPSLVTSISAQYIQSKKGVDFIDGTGIPDDDDDSGIDLALSISIDEGDIDAEYVATAALIREFWSRLGIEGAREAILVPDVGKEVKEQLRKLKQQDKKGVHQTVQGGEGNELQQDDDPDPDAGVDLARQLMEIFRFNR